MNTPKILAFDLDGTLLSGKGRIPASTRATLERLIKMGVVVVVATGRPWFRVKPLLEGLEVTAAVCSNGTMTVDPTSERILEIRTFERFETIAHLAEFGRTFDLFTLFVAYSAGPPPKKHAFSQGRRTAHADRVLTGFQIRDQSVRCVLQKQHRFSRMCFLPDPHLSDTHYRRLDHTFGRQGYPVYHYHHGGMIEILPARCSKASAVLTIAREHRISNDAMVAFGDDCNDAEMFTLAGTAVAMDHAPEALRRLANQTIAWQNGEGINTFLRHLFSL